MEDRLCFCMCLDRMRRVCRHFGRQRSNTERFVAGRGALDGILCPFGCAGEECHIYAVGAELSGLAPFAGSENGHAQYNLYVREGEEVLIRVQLRYLRGLLFWEGELYIDLTDGKSIPEQLRSFDGLDEGGKLTGKVYRYTTRYENGEYVSDAKISLPAADYYMTVMGQNKDSVFFLLGLLAKNS